MTGVGDEGTALGAVMGIHPSDPLIGLNPGLGFGRADWASTELVGLLNVLSRGPGAASVVNGTPFLFHFLIIFFLLR